MATTAKEAMKTVAQALLQLKPHELPNQVIVYGTYSEGDAAAQILTLDRLVGPYKDQAAMFAVALKNIGIKAELVLLTINGTLPDLRLRPVTVILSMTKYRECDQVVVDHKEGTILPSSDISNKDKEVCAQLFVSQASYHPEIEESYRWN